MTDDLTDCSITDCDDCPFGHLSVTDHGECHEHYCVHPSVREPTGEARSLDVHGEYVYGTPPMKGRRRRPSYS